LRIFNRSKVRYLVVGGYAVAKHAEPRYTKDLDIWISNSKKNAELVYEALREFGAPLNDIEKEDFTKSDLVYQIGIEPARVDILMGLKAMDFDECWQRRSTTTIGDLEIHFISIDDLIVNKQKTGRPQDLIDAKILKLKKQGQEKSSQPLPKKSD
jgi:hypothetical protein